MLKFENDFVNNLPGDAEKKVYTRQVANACFSFVSPKVTNNPSLVCTSNDVAELLNISASEHTSEEFTNLFSGNLLLEGMQPYSMRYGGHQFGHWAGQLGDGRAINLGEVKDCDGKFQTLQLKGAGLTPYSRTADGLAVLRSSVREFLCSEAMYYLGIPTTRALSLVLTGDSVMRDMFYDGRAKEEAGAVVCRVSPSFIRFGNFQIHATENEIDTLKKLADYSIQTNFPHLGEASSSAYENWFEEICQSTMQLMVDWMRVGFVHGVMNTDNMSILGQTIDYGPYGWLEGYDPNWTPNTTDAQGKRYCYGNQPQIAQWNLYQLANAIVPIIGRTEALEASLSNYQQGYQISSNKMYTNKLGLDLNDTKSNQELIDSLLLALQSSEIDMTIFFRSLSSLNPNKEYSLGEFKSFVSPAFYSLKDLDGEKSHPIIQWLKKYITCVLSQKQNQQTRVELMNKTNPKYILRNYLVQVAIDKADRGDFSEIEKLLMIMKKPYDEQTEHQSYAQKRPEWARNKAGCSMLSCSS